MSIVSVDTTSDVAVTNYLTRARDWLSRAVDETGPEQIAAAKAEVATAAEATKQLGLSREIQEEATELVRRFEYDLRRAVRKAQEAGEVPSRGDNLIPGARTRCPTDPPSSDDRPSASSFFRNKDEYEDANAMAALDSEEFDAVIEEAKAEGNLTRANVARKAREKSGRAIAHSEPTSASDDEALALLNDIRGPWTRGITKSARLMTPKARAHLINALENALTQIRNIR